MTLPDVVARSIDKLDAGYGDVLQRTIDVLTADRRVIALWLSGSVGRGVADAGSDLDLIITVDDGAKNDVVSAGDRMWTFLEPVISYEMPGLPGSFVLTTSDGLRVDALLEVTSDIGDTPYRHRIMVFDRRHPPSPIPRAAEAERNPDPARLEAIATEFARQLAIFPDAVVARRDWLLGQEAVHNYRRFLYDLYVEYNQPLPPRASSSGRRS